MSEETLHEKVRSEKWEAYYNALGELVRRRTEYIRAAIASIQKIFLQEAPLNEEDALRAERLMLFLGEMRAVEGMSLLTRQIDFRSPALEGMEEDLPPEIEYPAVYALILIGSPGKMVLVEEMKLFREEDSRTRLAALVLGHITGAPSAKALMNDRVKLGPAYSEALDHLNHLWPEK